MPEFVKDVTTGKIRLNKSTIEHYRSRFGRAGIDVRTIDTEEKFELAMRRIKSIWVAEFVDLVARPTELAKGIAPLREVPPPPPDDAD